MPMVTIALDKLQDSPAKENRAPASHGTVAPQLGGLCREETASKGTSTTIERVNAYHACPHFVEKCSAPSSTSRYLPDATSFSVLHTFKA